MAMIILRLWSPSPKYRHDLYRHRHDTMISIILISINVSSYGRLVNYCFCNYCYRIAIIVKQLYGACILCNKETTIRLLPVVDNFNKTWSSHTTTYISSRLDHITSQHALQKQVRCPLLCLLQVLRGCYGLKQEPILPTHQNRNDSLSSWCCFNLRKDRA